MALVGTEINDLPETPFSYAAIYNSDQLIAGPMQLVTKGQATITGGLALPRGTILGKVLVGALASAAKAGGNTGNGTNTLFTAGTKTKTGVYAIRFLTATTYTVVNPSGYALPNGVNGAYANPELNFTITAGGTPFIAGDGFDITVAAGANTYRKAVATAVDGSQNPCAILVDYADATGADVNSGAYLTGEFNRNRVAFDPSFTLLALEDALRPWNIHLKSALSNAAPT
jgi:hypothetical protein